jgi:hypothetical protein
MKRKRVWTLEDQMHDMQEMANDAGQVTAGLDWPIKSVLKQLENPSKKLRERTAPLIVSLNIAASSHETHGALAVLKGDPNGWCRMRLGFLYRAWSIRCRYAMVDREQGNKGLTYTPLLHDREPQFLMEAIATGDHACAHGLGRKVMANFQMHGGGDPLHFYSIPFQPFVFKLYLLWIGEAFAFRNDIGRPLGPFQPIIDRWEKKEDFAKALLELCDYHCEQTFGDEKRGVNTSFSWWPYNVFPVEILAIQRIRRDLGLPCPPIDHPLLKSPLVKVPIALPIVSDNLLDRIKERARADFPEVGDPW